MRIYNPQNQFGQDLITKNQVTLITGLEGLKGDKNIDQRLTAVEQTAPSTALHTIDGDETDALAKISFTIDATDSTKAKASLSTVKATLTEGVISGEGIATGTQVAAAIGKETTRATGVEAEIKADIGSWSSGSAYEHSSVKAAIENISAITGFKVVSVLPASGEKNTIYLVKPQGADSYEEWIYVEVSAGTMQWEKIGDTDIKLTDYYKKTEIGTGFDTTNTVKKYIEDQDTAVKNTDDTASATSTDTHVSVSLTGTVGDHGLTVTTSDIASASALTTLTGRVDTAEGDIDAVEAKLVDIPTTVKAYVDAETTRATTAESGLDGRLDDVEDKLVGLPTGKTIKQAIEDAVAGEASRATTEEEALAGRATALETKVGTATLNTTAQDLSGAVNELKSAVDTDTTAIGTLANLTTEAKGNLVAAINEVDAHADTAQATAEARLASIAGNNGGGVAITFTTDASKAVTTAVSVTESTLDDDSKFATTDTAVATGAKVQAAIDAAEQRAKDAQTYTADGTTLQLSGNEFSAKTAAVAENGTALTTGGQVWTAVDDAKTVLLGNTSITTTEKTITKAIALAEAAQTAVNTEVTTRKADVNAILDGTKHAVGTMLELAVVAKDGVNGTFTITGKPEDVSTLHIVRVEWNHEDYMCKHSGNDVVLWNTSDVWPETATKPQASEIKVFALVTATTSVAG